MADTPKSLKAVVISNSFYTVFFEQYQNLTFIHIDLNVVYRASIKQAMIHDLKILMSLRDSPIFALHNPSDLKHKKFLKLMGFTYLQPVACIDKTAREIFIKEVT
jgi:hypothetical protein